MLVEGIGGAYQLTGIGLGGDDPYRAIGACGSFHSVATTSEKEQELTLGSFPRGPGSPTRPPGRAG